MVGGHEAPAPLVSVVTATYAGDDPAQLAEAVDSVLAQGHRPIQYLIVCDGPITPAAEDLLAARTNAHPFVTVFRHDAGAHGPAAARNAALARCDGEFVAILDADDAMAPDRIAEQVQYLDRHGLDMVASWLTVVDQAGRETGVRALPETWREVRAHAPYSCPTANPSVMLRRSLLPRFRYPEHLRVGEDYRLWVTLLRAGVRIGNVPRPLTRYRTGSSYFTRRRGWGYATSDLATKLLALPLAPWWQWPLVVAVAGATFVVRLLPDRLFRVAYAEFDRVGRGAHA